MKTIIACLAIFLASSVTYAGELAPSQSVFVRIAFPRHFSFEVPSKWLLSHKGGDISVEAGSAALSRLAGSGSRSFSFISIPQPGAVDLGVLMGDLPEAPELTSDTALKSLEDALIGSIGRRKVLERKGIKKATIAGRPAIVFSYRYVDNGVTLTYEQIFIYGKASLYSFTATVVEDPRGSNLATLARIVGTLRSDE